MTQSDEPFDPYYRWLGIPPDEQPANHYRLLGIKQLEENREVIQNAADRQMAHLRTFQTGPRTSMSQRLLNEVAAARVCLLSTDKKSAYDQQLRSASAAASPVPPATRPTPPAPTPPVTGPAAPAAQQTAARSDSAPQAVEDPGAQFPVCANRRHATGLQIGVS